MFWDDYEDYMTFPRGKADERPNPEPAGKTGPAKRHRSDPGRTGSFDSCWAPPKPWTPMPQDEVDIPIKSNISRQRKHQLKYPEKEKARRALKRAIKYGILHKSPCNICGDISVEGHHEDYSKPLDITWLCRKHHLETYRPEQRPRTKLTLEDAATIKTLYKTLDIKDIATIYKVSFHTIKDLVRGRTWKSVRPY